MIIWFAILIPIAFSSIAYLAWDKKFIWWEILLPIVTSFLFILIAKFGIEKSMLSDTEYRGGLIVEARYYEYWETWVKKTCSQQYACGTYTTGTGKNRVTHTKYCTRYYDCSYCDRNDPYWVAYDTQGHSWRITEKEYLRLLRQWNATPEFVELNRSINYKNGCGKDGDMYRIRWNNDMLTSESSTWTETYENHVQLSKSHFDLREVSDEEAKKYNLYDYPNLKNYHQPNVLGLDSMNFLTTNQKFGVKKMFEYFNGANGPTRKIRLYILLYHNKSIDIAVKQKNYWVGGNKNEMVVCIGLDKNTGKLDWVYPFSWSENKRVSVDIREDVMDMETLNFTKLYHILDESTKTFTYRDFKQFNYLSIDPPTWSVWFVYIITFIISISLIYYGYTNEYEEDGLKSRYRY